MTKKELENEIERLKLELEISKLKSQLYAMNSDEDDYDEDDEDDYDEDEEDDYDEENSSDCLIKAYRIYHCSTNPLPASGYICNHDAVRKYSNIDYPQISDIDLHDVEDYVYHFYKQVSAFGGGSPNKLSSNVQMGFSKSDNDQYDNMNIYFCFDEGSVFVFDYNQGDVRYFDFTKKHKIETVPNNHEIILDDYSIYKKSSYKDILMCLLYLQLLYEVGDYEYMPKKFGMDVFKKSFDNETDEFKVDVVAEQKAKVEKKESLVWFCNRAIAPKIEYKEYLKYQEILKEVADACLDVYRVLEKQIQECDKKSDKWAWIEMHFWSKINLPEDNGQYPDELLEEMRDATYGLLGKYPDNISKGYIRMCEVRNALVNESKAIRMNTESTISRASRIAYAEALSSIKPLPFGIITNSFWDAVSYKLLSDHSLKSQARMADRKMAREIGNAAKERYAVHSDAMVHLFYDEYVVLAKECIAYWGQEILEKYMSHCYETYYFYDLKECEKLSTKKSDEILESISKESDKKIVQEKLIESFENNPFYKRNYEEALKRGFDDDLMIKTAARVGIKIIKMNNGYEASYIK